MAAMAEEKTRVDFNAPVSLVERADLITDLLDISRTQLLIDALRDEIEERAGDDSFRRMVGDAYYAGDVDFETVESILGTEEAMRMKLLRESIRRDPPEPRLSGELPPPEAFYDGDVPEWTPAGDTDDVESRT